MFEINKSNEQLDISNYDHFAGIHPFWHHLILFIGVLSFSLTVLITLLVGL